MGMHFCQSFANVEGLYFIKQDTSFAYTYLHLVLYGVIPNDKGIVLLFILLLPARSVGRFEGAVACNLQLPGGLATWPLTSL